MNVYLTDSRLGSLAARRTHDAFCRHRSEFDSITRRAAARFEARDWRGMQADHTERLELSRETIDRLEEEIRGLLGDRLPDRMLWAGVKAVFSSLIEDRDDWDIAETFFNSLTRRIFATVGVDPRIEFVDTDFEAPPTPATSTIYRTYDGGPSNAALIEAILRDQRFLVPFEDIYRDARNGAAALETNLRRTAATTVVDRVEMLEPVFHRGQGAYLVGRLHAGGRASPLALALHHGPRGIRLDAVLPGEDDVSILFSFTRSHFHVEVPRPSEFVAFLKSVMPLKKIAELYISIGLHKHGKTELYRDLLHHLDRTDDRFEFAAGKPGMVMVVFTMPSHDLVLKVIRDRFPPPKSTTREAVMDRYRLVFHRDKNGRLIDAQEFEHLTFDRARFSDDLLDDLLRSAGRTVTLQGDQVVIRHAYVERRIVPLDVYLEQADASATRAAILDYGEAIKDLAASNIFPGDMLLKNFGVTRHGRVVFYDYDELCLLTECNFRRIPESRNHEQEMSDEPWFTVGEADIFPEEFVRFWGLAGALREAFLEQHEDLFGVDFWRGTQQRIESGEMIQILPYRPEQRL